jgi:hypothetical protein
MSLVDLLSSEVLQKHDVAEDVPPERFTCGPVMIRQRRPLGALALLLLARRQRLRLSSGKIVRTSGRKMTSRHGGWRCATIHGSRLLLLPREAAENSEQAENKGKKGLDTARNNGSSGLLC